MYAIRVNHITEVGQVSSWTQPVRSDSNLIGFFLGDNRMKQINISTKKHPDLYTLVDDSDYAMLTRHRWYSYRGHNTIYVQRKQVVDDKCTMPKMHRVIMNAPRGMQVDHRDGNGLNNQRYNLRLCTGQENARSRRLNKNNTSGYKGVHWSYQRMKWLAIISYNGKKIYLGGFFCIVRAAKAYDKKAVELFREFARLNFPTHGRALLFGRQKLKVRIKE